jgi:hypothetical protein
MRNLIEEAIAAFTENRSPEQLQQLHCVLVGGSFIVPVFADATEYAIAHWDIPVICLRRPDDTGSVPAFTSVEKLLEWKPEGGKFVELKGDQLIRMAENMSQISDIVVNPGLVPRGIIDRSEFKQLLALAAK